MDKGERQTSYDAILMILQRRGLCLNPNLQDAQGRTILHLLYGGVTNDTGYGSVALSVAQMLLESHGIDINLPDLAGMTALHTTYQTAGLLTACSPGSIYKFKEMVQLLLENPHVQINHQDGNGMTALHHVCKCDVAGLGKDVVKMLMGRFSLNPNLREFPGSTATHGGTALHHAVKANNADLVEMIISLPTFDREYHNGPRHYSVFHIAVDGAAEPRRWRSMLKFLFSQDFLDADIRDQSALGLTPLMKAAEKQDIAWVKLLLKSGKVKADQWNCHALAQLLTKYRLWVSKWAFRDFDCLLRFGGKSVVKEEMISLLYEKDLRGRTLIWPAAIEGCFVFLEQLLDICPMELDLSADSHGITPLRCLQEHLFTHRFSTSGDGDGFRVVLQMLATGMQSPSGKERMGRVLGASSTLILAAACSLEQISINRLRRHTITPGVR